VKLLFWLSLLLILYACFIFPCLLYLRARLHPRPVRKKSISPTISLVIAVRNEGQNLERKLSNLRELDYQGDLIETIIVSDGSTDETNAILEKAVGVRAIFLEIHAGKAEAINRAVEAATGELIVFMDVRQRLAIDSIKMLVEGFADPAVGCVSGALELGDGDGNAPRGVGSYWRMEKSIRNWESASRSVVGATGALYAVRRTLVPKIPGGTILDDVFIPMEVVRQGKRVTFEPRAIIWDTLPSNPQREFRRKVRTLFGNYQLLRVAPWLLTRRNPLRFEFVSHKLVRLTVPFALIGMILSSALLSGLIYRLPIVGAIGIAALGALAYVRVPLGFVSRVTDLALAFVLLNVAAIVAFVYFSFGKKQVWIP
jgi:biofilm PGA synthesis N-glycosyltransferase PgaC